MTNKNISEWSPMEIKNMYRDAGSFRKAARRSFCSVSTFCKYYGKAINSRLNTKSVSSDVLLDPGRCRTAILDIETTGLAADFSVMLCAVVKEFGTDYMKTFNVCLDAKDILESEKQMIVDINEELGEFDAIITYYGSRFDIPFLRTRALFHGIEPLPRIKHLDMYFTVRNSTNPGTRRLDRMNQILQNSDPEGSPSKTSFDITPWIRVLHSRDEDALDYIVDHCQKDVLILENLVNRFSTLIPDRITRH
jgi:uncharacterized protein YprB with RNaseH-like and TPR domain